MPIVTLYGLLFLLGVSNVIRFCRVDLMTPRLSFIYTLSLISNVAFASYIAIVMQNNVRQYVPYSTAIYSKLLVGIAYQFNIIDLKYVVGYFFTTEKHKEDEELYERRRRNALIAMILLSALVIIIYFTDFYFIFVREYLLTDATDSK